MGAHNILSTGEVKMNTKALKVMANKKGPHYVIGWVGGGEVPLALSGFYTSQGEAQSAIDVYVGSKSKPNKGFVSKVTETLKG